MQDVVCGHACRLPDNHLSGAAASANEMQQPSRALVAQLARLLRVKSPATTAAACAALSHCARRQAAQQPPWWAAAAELHADVAIAVGQRPQLLAAAAELLPNADWVLVGAIASLTMAHCQAEGNPPCSAFRPAARAAGAAARRAGGRCSGSGSGKQRGKCIRCRLRGGAAAGSRPHSARRARNTAGAAAAMCCRFLHLLWRWMPGTDHLE